MEKMRLNNRQPLKRASRIDEVLPSPSLFQQQQQTPFIKQKEPQHLRALSESELRLIFD